MTKLRRKQRNKQGSISAKRPSRLNVFTKATRHGWSSCLSVVDQFFLGDSSEVYFSVLGVSRYEKTGQIRQKSFLSFAALPTRAEMTSGRPS